MHDIEKRPANLIKVQRTIQQLTHTCIWSRFLRRDAVDTRDVSFYYSRHNVVHPLSAANGMQPPGVRLMNDPVSDNGVV